MRNAYKLLAALCLSSLLLIAPMHSRAFAPAVVIAGWLLDVTYGSMLVGDLFAGISGTIAAVLWYDCNKFKNTSVCTNKPSSMPSSQAPSEGLTVKLAPDAKRSNPDPKIFDDSRESKPKSSIPATASGGGSPAPDGSDTFFWGSTYDGKLVTGQSVASVARSIAFYGDCGSFSNCVYPGLTRVDYPVILNGPSSTANGSKCKIQHSYSGGHYWTNGSTTWPRPANVNGASCQPSNVTGTPAYTASPPTTYICPNGYTLSGQVCNLTDPNLLQKPASTPCEVLYYADSKEFKTDPQNTANCANVPQGQSMALQSNDDTGSSLTIQPNNDGGFDITQKKGNGQSITARTGPYDPTGGGYHFTSTSTNVPSGQSQDGQGDGCGVPGKPSCSIQITSDTATDGVNSKIKSDISSGNDQLKGALDGIDKDKFQWKFIPQIPTAKCVNPRVKNPLSNQSLDVDICSGFNHFSFFLNAIFAILCVYGCTQQIRQAMKS